ncbi:MAG: hypothetical protein U0457_01000 [Candidatus Sericytochromatia bacterium]
MDGANGTGNFKYSYVVGRIKSADLRTNNLLLNPLGGFTTGAPIQYGANAGQNPLKSAKVEGNVITLEFNLRYLIKMIELYYHLHQTLLVLIMIK